MLLMAVALAQASAINAAPREGEKKVVVDGSVYRVHVTRNSVTVAKKAFAVRYNLDERDRMRKAVTLATGCRAVDEIATTNGKLRARLDCQR